MEQAANLHASNWVVAALRARKAWGRVTRTEMHQSTTEEILREIEEPLNH